ncbi:hypothetical protein PAMA_013575 [Pampus argenteus]
MDGVQVIITCVLLTVTSDFCAAQQVSVGCSTCPPGYYVKQLCRREADGRFIGVQCKLCKKCSAGQVTQVNCSMFADSLCGDETTPSITTTPTATRVSTPEHWTILTVIVVFVFLILLLSLLLLLMLSCRNNLNHQRKSLPPHNTSLLLDDKPLPPHDKLLSPHRPSTV